MNRGALDYKTVVPRPVNRRASPSYVSAQFDPNSFDRTKARRLVDGLAFDVASPSAGPLDGLPCLKVQGAIRYVWCLPSLGRDFDFQIGWEMGLAYLRARYCPDCTELDPAPLELVEISLAFASSMASKDHRDSFFVCVGVFLDHAMHAHDQMPVILRRLAWLNDERLRDRCKALLNGWAIADIFDDRFDLQAEELRDGVVP